MTACSIDLVRRVPEALKPRRIDIAGGPAAPNQGLQKELIGFQVGVRESAQSWRELLVESNIDTGYQ